MVTKAEAEAILAEEKVITKNLRWTSRGPRFELEAAVGIVGQPVDPDEPEKPVASLRLVGYVGKTNRSFALLCRNFPIRKYTVHDHHTNPKTGEVVYGPHKHTWDDDWEDGLVYVPADIRIGDANEELVDFLHECNIRLEGAYQPLMGVQSTTGGAL